MQPTLPFILILKNRKDASKNLVFLENEKDLGLFSIHIRHMEKEKDHTERK